MPDHNTITGFHHTAVTVHDLDAMVRFYTEVIGLRVLMEVDSVAPPTGDHTGVAGARRKLVFVGFGDGHRIELVHYIDPPASAGHFRQHQLGAMHVCFRVSDLAATHARLSGAGVRFLTEPKFREMEGKRIGAVYAQDPEGNWIEFLEGA
jgi:catechol 2,3-dioxygenase-like lactoylglutathione lyase family enzyme